MAVLRPSDIDPISKQGPLEPKQLCWSGVTTEARRDLVEYGMASLFYATLICIVYVTILFEASSTRFLAKLLELLPHQLTHASQTLPQLFLQ
ncbi:protein of unknown function [Xenorhabdus nematophila AN6/1]|nr:protein of unknown function [Xenorhabdus nematophila AN6/1]